MDIHIVMNLKFCLSVAVQSCVALCRKRGNLLLCKEFLDILSYYCEGSMSSGGFVRELFENIYEHPRVRSSKYNPIANLSTDTFRGYSTGKSINALAAQIRPWLNTDKFTSYMEGLLTDKMRSWICEDLEGCDYESAYECTPQNIPKILAEQFKIIIDESAENHKHNITKNDEAKNPLIKAEDVPLIEETINKECPLCSKNLFLPKNSKRNYCQYKIVRIYDKRLLKKCDLFSGIIEKPENEDGNSNKIALCSSCAERYEKSPTIETYNTLKKLKKTLVSLNAKNNKLAPLQLEEDINKVLFSLTNLNDQDELTDLDLNLHPLSVQDKIKGHPQLLLETKDDVIHYFNYIQKVYSDLDCMKTGSDEIASDIGKAYRRIKDEGFNQEEIVNILSEWIIKKSGYLPEKSKYGRAARIIVSYYIQSCQVFEDATSK